MKFVNLLCLALCFSFGLSSCNQEKSVALTVKDGLVKMSNGILSIEAKNGIIYKMTSGDSENNLLSPGNGIYYDYYTPKTYNPFVLTKPSVEVVKQTSDYAEVLFKSTKGIFDTELGLIMRKGVSGVYCYIVLNGSKKSDNESYTQGRVVCRLDTTFRYGYVDDKYQGLMPSNAVMKQIENREHMIQDATYSMGNGEVYTKYNLSQHIYRDSIHGVMNENTGFWNIPCSYEYINGGPMRQELMVHTTAKSPLTIQTFQALHYGAKTDLIKNGEHKIFGPFFYYVNHGKSTKEMIADAKKQASQQMKEWPFSWFKHPLYANQRSKVTGQIKVTNGMKFDSLRVILAQPGKDPYLQSMEYMFWTTADKEGNFVLDKVRDGNYSLYAYAMNGDITDQLEKTGIKVNAADLEIGTIEWRPTKYEYQLWQLGESDRFTDGFCMSDAYRKYDNYKKVPADLDFTIGKSNPAKDWYFAQTKTGKWNLHFDLDKTYSGQAHLTIAFAGCSKSPKYTVYVNGKKVAEWNLPASDGALHRSGIRGGSYVKRICHFDTSLLKKGKNTISFEMEGTVSPSRIKGVMYDCIKLETGAEVK